MAWGRGLEGAVSYAGTSYSHPMRKGDDGVHHSVRTSVECRHKQYTQGNGLVLSLICLIQWRTGPCFRYPWWLLPASAAIIGKTVLFTIYFLSSSHFKRCRGKYGLAYKGLFGPKKYFQAFSPCIIWLLSPPPPPPLTDRMGGGERGKEPANHTTARKPGPL